MKKIISILIFLACFTMIGKAQEALTHNLYTANPYLINPAAAGDVCGPNIFLDAYNQWTGFSNAPKVYTFGIHSPIFNNMGLGLMIYDDQRSVLQHVTGQLSYSYNVKFKENVGLAFGINLGFVRNTIYMNGITPVDPTDPAYMDAFNYNQTDFTAGAGLLFHYYDFKFHFSLPQMIEHGSNFEAQYNILGLYDFNLNNQFTLTPSVLVRAFPANVMQTDINAKLDWNKTFWIQLGIRTDKSFLGSVGVNWGILSVSYSYQYVTNDVNIFSANTNEIMVALKFCKEKSQPVVETPKVDPNKEKVNIVANMVDQKSKDPVAGKIVLKQNDKVVYTGTSDSKGVVSIYAEPAVYNVEVTSKGYLPVNEDLDLSKNAKGSKYTYELKPMIKLEKGLVFKFASVNFETAKDILLPESKHILDLVSQIFLDYPKIVCEVAGHTDNVGDDQMNLTLSQKRAVAVVNYLKSKGVKDEQMKAKGYGKTKPIVANDTPENRLQNRRVEFTVLEF